MRRAFAAWLLVLVAAPAAAWAQQPVVYSSLPLQGPLGGMARDIVRGIELANEHAGRPVRYVSLDDSTRRAGTWVPERVAANARRVVDDDRTIAYIGELNSGASAISIPILNDTGILQVSPSNTAIGLTEDGPGAEPGEPDRYYPSGRRTFGRVIPNDQVQGGAAATLLRDLGVKRLFVAHDGEVYGRGLANLVAQAARARGIRVVRSRRLARRGRNAAALAREARRRRADGLFYGGVTANGAVRLWRAMARNRRLRWLVGGDGVAETGFTRRIPRRTRRKTRVMIDRLAPEGYPAGGQEILAALGAPDPYALYGYEAMRLVLDSLARGGPTRQGVIDAFFATRDRDSVLGRYSIDANGDTTFSVWGAYRLSGGSLIFDRAVDAATP
jgi:branched-chain amino acid transport system substrate-binding protein